MRNARTVSLVRLVVLAGAAAWAGEAAAAAKVEVKPPAKSPTLGQKPPAGAVVLLPFEEGKPTSLDKWANASWQTLPDGSIVKGKGNQLTKADLGDMHLHVEFLIPPGKDGAKPEGGGNSGLYIMDRYEIQILDSFGRQPGPGECGAIYRKVAPTQNACLPVGQWQTYDITFVAPKFDASGAKTAPARVTVVLNGVKVQDNVEMPTPTGAAGKKPEVPAAPLCLQDHGCPVQFRNMWYTAAK